jgi:AcrR family transcriptional regulator
LSTWGHYDAAVRSTRDKLVEAAARLLDQGGPAAVTLRAVADRCGVSHNAPYKHFASKEALLAAIASRELAGSPQPAQSKGADALATLRTMIHGYVRWARSHPARFKLTFGAWSQGTDELAQAASAARQRLVQAVAAAMQAKQIARGDPERVGYLILALAHGAADLALGGHLSASGKGKAEPEDLVDDLLAILRRS